MRLLCNPTQLLQGNISAPKSKSHSIRAIIVALLSTGTSNIIDALQASDIDDALRVCQDLGANIHHHANTTQLHSPGVPLHNNTNTIYTGSSGITTRFILPTLGLRKNHQEIVIVDSSEQMRQRPIEPLVNALRTLGLTIKYVEQENSLPIAVSGQLQGGKTTIDGTSSQYLSALLLNLPCCPSDSEITVKNLQERPYIDLTLQWLNKYQIQYTEQRDKDHTIFYIPGKQRYIAMNNTIAGDYSSASYVIAAATMIPGKVILNGLDINDRQGDKKLIELLQTMGANIEVNNDHLIINGGHRLKGIDINANDIPDLLPTLAVIGTYAEGKTTLSHVKHARIKETDRIHSMCEGLRAMHATVKETDDGMIVHQSRLIGATVKGYDDHRTVMALSLVGMLAEGTTTIIDAEAINKTYPKYISTMASVGAQMEVIDNAQ